jgi:CheY-like chemotaxis protein
MMAGLKILVVDDSHINRFVTRELLVKQGHEVVLANSGEAAFLAFQKNQIDLVLMDISMPGLDGLEATAIIRESSRAGAEVTMLAFTAHTCDFDIQKYLETGLDGYVSKPVTGEQLRIAVSQYCSS